MPSDYVFESGEPIDVGSHGETSYLFHSGEPVPNSGESTLVYESGVGLGGGGATFVIRDNSGEVSGGVPIISRDKTVEEFYGYESGSPSASAGGEAGTTYGKDGYLSFMVFQNTGTGDLSLVVVYDEHDGDYPGGLPFDVDYSGFGNSTSIAVRDDDTDSYSLSPPSGYTSHTWGGNNTDGVVWKTPFGETITASLGGGLDASYKVRGIGDDGSTVERDVIENETVVEISV